MHERDVLMLLIAVGGVLVALALFLGRGFKISKGENGYSAETQAAASKPGSVSVAENLEAENASLGNVTGAKSSGVQAGVTGDINVMNNAKLKGTRVKDITGLEHDGGGKPL